MGRESDPVLEAARASGLLEPGRRVVVLLSGGRDSVCLLDVAVRLCGPGLVSALHVNYGLRPEADGDQDFCAALCRAMGVSLGVHRPRARAGGNLQAWARAERYGAASRLALATGALVAAGHTASDQAETVLYRLASSPGRRALLGMAPRAGLVVRPLLEVTREQVTAYCRARGLRWREDASNANRDYARNRARHDLVPALRALHPAAERNVARTARVLREESAALQEIVEGMIAGRGSIPQAELAELPPALARLVVRDLAERAAGAPVPQAATRLDELLALAPTGSNALDLGTGVRAHVEYGELRMEAGPPDAPAGPVALTVPGSACFGALRVVCDPAPATPMAGTLDADRLAPELVVRAWRPGDRMAPLGLGGTKSLQDLFGDLKVPRARRASVPVVESGGEIAWVAGVATSERFRVTAATARAVRLSAGPAA